MNLYLRMLRWVKPYWKILVGGILVSLLFVIFNSASVWLTASFVNVIFPQEHHQVIQKSKHASPKTALEEKLDLNTKIKNLTNKLLIRENPLASLKILCLMIFTTFLLKNVFFYLKNVALGFVQLKLITDLRNALYSHFHHLSLSYFHRKKGGELLSITLNDVGVMRRAFTVSFDKLLVEPINILMFFILLFIISWKLTLLAVVILPLSFITISKVGQSIRRKSLRSSKKIAGIMAILSETIQGIRVVKAFAMEAFEKRRFFQETEKYFQILFKRKKLQTVSTPLNEALGVVVGVALLWIGGSLVLTGQSLEAEDFIRFIILLFAILNPIKSLNTVNVDIQEGMASAMRVFSILDEKSDIIECQNPLKIENFGNTIRFEHVSFRYDAAADYVLNDIDLEVHRGEILAIVGHSGVGKSTLVDLIPRFYDPTEGRVTIDGSDIKTLTLSSLRSLMGIVTQETILFNDTIFNNIAYGLENADSQQVTAAAKAANALEFINEFPEKFETTIGDRGARLSGGQAQRVAIARALLKNPPILILDEATSALDTESEQKVQAAIDNLIKDRTVFVIAHRLATIQNATKIIVLDKGRIVESGTHQELLNKNGLYRYYYDIQFKLNNLDS
jgi:subfamily B ATP-binding cassette protein MsbA